MSKNLFSENKSQVRVLVQCGFLFQPNQYRHKLILVKNKSTIHINTYDNRLEELLSQPNKNVINDAINSKVLTRVFPHVLNEEKDQI